MVEAAERVADVMQEGADDIFLVAAIAVGAGGGLQRMGQPVDREAAIVSVQQFQMAE